MTPPPVLLLPGWSDDARRLRWLRSFLVEAGWPEARVEIVERASRFGSSVEHAERIDAAATRLLAATGEPAVDVVAHSMGGLAARWWLAGAGADKARKVIFLATPHRGTWAAWLAWGAGGRELRPGSELLRRLAAAPVPPAVRLHTIRTRRDLRIFPPSSATLPGAEDIVLWMPTHPGLIRSRAVFDRVRRILLDP
ncbi:MAG TPA: hypothetical protein VFQ38_05450 [Longimicrobiales bacterium]|nr:hypothetical protein [Longimicrobiales bacterium]